MMISPETKRCYECKLVKSTQEFNKNKSKYDGFQNRCKNCITIYKKEYTQRESTKALSRKHGSKYSSSEHGRKRQRDYKSSPEGKKNMKASKKKTLMKYINASRCRYKTKYAIKVGYLIRPEFCDNCKVHCKPQAHHKDYNLPRSIDWLCHSCHSLWHRNNTPLNRSSSTSGEA